MLRENKATPFNWVIKASLNEVLWSLFVRDGMVRLLESLRDLSKNLIKLIKEKSKGKV